MKVVAPGRFPSIQFPSLNSQPENIDATDRELIEQLGREMGMYTDYPFGRVGYVDDKLFPAARLVVDTGIHHLRSNRAQAVDCMTGITGKRTEAKAEIDRYCVWPGQAPRIRGTHVPSKSLRYREFESLRARLSAIGRNINQIAHGAERRGSPAARSMPEVDPSRAIANVR